MSRVKGNGPLGQTGYPVKLTCIPDATFEAQIDALAAAGTDVIGKLVNFTFLNNYEVTSTANDTAFDGEITDYSKAGTTYDLTVQVFSYVDQNGTRHPCTGVKNFRYSGTIALQDTVWINGATYMYVDDAGTGGWGAVVSKDAPASSYVDVLI